MKLLALIAGLSVADAKYTAQQKIGMKLEIKTPPHHHVHDGDEEYEDPHHHHVHDEDVLSKSKPKLSDASIAWLARSHNFSSSAEHAPAIFSRRSAWRAWACLNTSMRSS